MRPLQSHPPCLEIRASRSIPQSPTARPASPVLISGPQTLLQAGKSYFRPRVWILPPASARSYSRKGRKQRVSSAGEGPCPSSSTPPPVPTLSVFQPSQKHRGLFWSP